MQRDSFQRIFSDHRLPAPPLPTALLDNLQQLDELLLASDQIAVSPFELDFFLNQMLDRQQPFALIGHAGHGTANWAMHYYLHWQGLTVALQSPWGGVATDNKRAANRLRQRFTQIDRLLTQNSMQHELLPGRPVVVESFRSGDSWGWQGADGEVDWQADGPDVFAAALAAIEQQSGAAVDASRS
jgi:hypothetical protein